MLPVRCLVSTVTLQMALCGAASAQSLLGSVVDVIRTGSFASFPTDWTVTVGIEGRASPSYYGSGNLNIDPVPVFSLRPEGKTARFRSMRDSPSIALIHLGGFYAGPTGRFQKARKEADHDELRGLGDVDWALEVGFFAEYWATGWFRTRAEVRRGFNGHEGFVADLSADFIAPLGDKWSLSGGPRMSLATASALQPYFGVDVLQSAASGLPVFDTKGGLKSVGVGGQLKYQWTQEWASRVYVEYERLVGDAGASPIVTERGSSNQTTVGVGLTYSFNYKIR